jgi:hypothetical protein
MRNILLVIGMSCSALAHGTTIDLRAEAIEVLDGERTLVLELANVIATATSGVTNRTRSGFGVNAPGGADVADAIDGKAESEAISVQFSEQVRLVAIALSGFGRSDVAEFLLDDLVLPATDSGLVTSTLTSPNARALALRHVNGNGFSLDRIEFAPLVPEFRYNTHAAAVAAPAPGVAALSLLGLTLVLGARRSRRPRATATSPYCGTEAR